MPQDHIRNIAIDILLTLLTCGLFNLVVQYKQIRAVNYMVREERYSFGMWLLLTLVTCGLYHIYHEYRKSSDIAAVTGRPETEAVVNLILTIFGLSVVADAIQQSQINGYFGSTQL